MKCFRFDTDDKILNQWNENMYDFFRFNMGLISVRILYLKFIDSDWYFVKINTHVLRQ